MGTRIGCCTRDVTRTNVNRKHEVGVRVIPPSVEDLIARITVSDGKIRDMQGIFEKVRNSMKCRCQATSGHNFEHLQLQHLRSCIPM
ncbi:hypothetical protein TNCV_168081 [Trichonephila clavipes]|nr:hypothetical protein TNCV_168081 [Trichonephila clavipes]